MNVLRSVAYTNLVTSCKFTRNCYPVLPLGFITATLDNKLDRPKNANCYSTTAAAESNGIFGKILNKFANSKSRLRASSSLLYENVDKLNFYEFFDTFGLPDTFNSWFLVTELHCWLILTRTMNEGSETGQDGRFIRNCIVETLWLDVQSRAKKLSNDNPSASRKQVAVLAEQFQATLISYDEGLNSDDKILASALWRRFFSMNCDDYSKLEKLVKYVRRVSHQLDGMKREELIVRPQINWGKITD